MYIRSCEVVGLGVNCLYSVFATSSGLIVPSWLLSVYENHVRGSVTLGGGPLARASLSSI